MNRIRDIMMSILEIFLIILNNENGGFNMDDKTEKLLLKQYEVLCNFNINHDQQFWTQYSIFLAINGALLYAFMVNNEKNYFGWLGVVGLIVSMVWLYTTNRNALQRDFRIKKMRFIESELYHDLKVYKVWNNALNNYLSNKIYNIPEKQRTPKEYLENNENYCIDYRLLDEVWKEKGKFKELLPFLKTKGTTIGIISILSIIGIWIILLLTPYIISFINFIIQWGGHFSNYI